MKVQKGERRGDVVVLRATATAGEVESAFNRAEETFSEQMNLKPEDGKTIAEAAFEQLSIANLETVVAPQVLEALVPFAVQQTSIMPAFPPRPIAASTPMRGKAFSFDIELTPKRNYELSSYEPVEFTIEPYREDSEEVERQLERMVAGSAQYRALNPRPVEKDDICLLRVEATINGSISRGLTTEGRPYHMGKGNLPEEFDRNILGMEVGQSKSFEFSGPSIDEKGEPTVDTVSCTVTVLEIQELVQEELSDEWVTRYLPMYKDLADLRSSVSRAVNHRNLVEYENCNAVQSNSDNFYGHWIVDCLQRGSKMITIDPSLTWLASRSEYWLRLRPGTDGAMALAWLNVIIEEDLYDHDFVEKWTYGFDELAERVKDWTPEKAAEICWVPAETIRDAARAYAKNSPSAIQWGLPIDQAVWGIPTAQAINAIWAITGNTDVPGGNIIIMNAFGQNVSYNYGYDLLTPEMQGKRIGSEYPLMAKAGFSSTAHSDSILEAIETGKPYPIRMLWLTSTNPIANMGADGPRIYRACKKLDFCVVNDLFLTPTAVAFADIFLPGAMSAERDAQRVWWVPLRSMKKVTSYANVKSDDTIVTDLGHRLHPENFPWTDEKGWQDHILRTETPEYGKGFDDLCKEVYAYPEFNYRKYEKGLLRPDGQPGFNTPTGRIELYDSIFSLWGYDPLPDWKEPHSSPYSRPDLAKEYPYVLTTGARHIEFFHSEHRQPEVTSRELYPDPHFEMSEKAAAKLGIKDEDWCWIENQHGRCRQRLRINPSLDDRVVRADHGWWFPEEEAAEPRLFGVFDSNINNLVPQCDNGETGYGAPYKNQLCKVYKCTEENSRELPSIRVSEVDGYSKPGATTEVDKEYSHMKE